MYFGINVFLFSNITKSAEVRKPVSLKIPESKSGATNILPVSNP